MKRLECYDEMLNSGEFYDCNNPELLRYQFKCKREMNSYNKTSDSVFGIRKRKKLLSKMFAKVGVNPYIEPPFHANFGGKNVYIGDNFYANFNLTLVDDAKITIGNNVMIGPNVTVITPVHPLDVETRLSKKNQKNFPVIIKDNVWIASNVTIFPGVTIGKNSIIGANSVVTKDIPDNVLAFGAPAEVKKKLD